ncbi:MAG: NADAR family protein [Bacteroidales bacterium]|nr:NADAR family protein [Bacteroidales bacterium]
MNFYSIAPFIQQHYPEYYSIERYPADRCACIRKVAEEWGILGNFARTPLVVEGVTLKNSEQLFQLMKFKDEAPVKAVYQAANPKYVAKHWEKTHRRSDWGSIIVDVMKFCLTLKYQQSEAFRSSLLLTNGLFIVEDQTTFPKKTADTWGTKLVGNEYVGPNLLGRLLMELRDNGELKYSLPDDALLCLNYLK